MNACSHNLNGRGAYIFFRFVIVDVLFDLFHCNIRFFIVDSIHQDESLQENQSDSSKSTSKQSDLHHKRWDTSWSVQLVIPSQHLNPKIQKKLITNKCKLEPTYYACIIVKVNFFLYFLVDLHVGAVNIVQWWLVRTPQSSPIAVDCFLDQRCFPRSFGAKNGNLISVSHLGISKSVTTWNCWYMPNWQQ